MTVTSAQQPTGESAHQPLRALLEVEPDSRADCAVVSSASNAAAVTQSFGGSDNCHSEITVVDDGESERSYVTSETNAHCICGTISQFDCVFDLKGVSNGSLVIGLVVENRTLLSRIVSALKETGATVRLRRLAHQSMDRTVQLRVDATDITDKQQEAVELAAELGYYDRPRGATLEDLADRLGISKSAVSQRLNAVELTLVQSFVAD